MKRFFRFGSILGLVLCAASFVQANDYKSVVVSSGSPLTIDVSGERFLILRNFTQDAAGSTRGTVTATINSVPTSVLAAAIIDPANTTSVDVINSTVVAGPATVTVTCGTGATCLISYKKEGE